MTQNLYHKATASPTVFKGTVYYPVYQPPEGGKCNVGNAYVCAADDECGINTSEEIGRASRQMDANAGFDEKTGCYYLQPGVLSKLEVFADKLFAKLQQIVKIKKIHLYLYFLTTEQFLCSEEIGEKIIRTKIF